MNSVWQYIYDVVYWFVEGSAHAEFAADMIALLFAVLLAYLLLVMPLQLVIRVSLSFMAAVTGTLPFSSKKYKHRKNKWKNYIS
jgi:hypothetical protein